jgi:hypothetical protein
MIITLEITDEQAQALEDYANHPINLEWYRDERLQQNMPRRKFATGEDILADGIAKFLAGVVAQCPPQSVRDAQTQLETLQNQIQLAGVPRTVRMAR